MTEPTRRRYGLLLTGDRVDRRTPEQKEADRLVCALHPPVLVRAHWCQRELARDPHNRAIKGHYNSLDPITRNTPWWRAYGLTHDEQKPLWAEAKTWVRSRLAWRGMSKEVLAYYDRRNDVSGDYDANQVHHLREDGRLPEEYDPATLVPVNGKTHPEYTYRSHLAGTFSFYVHLYYIKTRMPRSVYSQAMYDLVAIVKALNLGVEPDRLASEHIWKDKIDRVRGLSMIEILNPRNPFPRGSWARRLLFPEVPR